jgi:hypothetical protein
LGILDIKGEVFNITGNFFQVVGRAIITMLIGVPNREITENGK